MVALLLLTALNRGRYGNDVFIRETLFWFAFKPVPPAVLILELIDKSIASCPRFRPSRINSWWKCFHGAPQPTVAIVPAYQKAIRLRASCLSTCDTAGAPPRPSRPLIDRQPGKKRLSPFSLWDRWALFVYHVVMHFSSALFSYICLSLLCCVPMKSLAIYAGKCA